MTSSSEVARLPRQAMRAVVTALLGAVLTLVGVTTATAAPPYETEAEVTDLQFTSEVVRTGSTAELTGSWSLPDNPATPAGFTMALPEGLQGVRTEFPMRTPSGEQMGSCVVDGTSLTCDLDEAYVAEHPLDLKGDFRFWVTVTTEVTEETEVTYDFGATEASVTIEPRPDSQPCTENCEVRNISTVKWGDYDPESGNFLWVVRVGAEDETGMPGGREVVVTDTVAPGHQVVPGQTVLRRTNEVVVNGNGYPSPANWVEAPVDSYQVSADGTTVTFTSEEGYFYVVDVVSEITDGGLRGTYDNAATIEVTGEEVRTVSARSQSHGGSASGVGTDVGVFALTKEVIGDAVGLEGTVFTGTYEVQESEGAEPTQHTFEVMDGETWVSPEFPAGTRVVILGEDPPTGTGQVQWADPVFSETEFVLDGGVVRDVSLTNEASVLMGQFSAAKLLTGDGAAQVPADATFTLDYSFPAGPGFESGAGELVLPVDGTAVTSPMIPAGAEVTVVEQEPGAVAGASWGAVTYSTESVRIVADEVVEMSVTNEITVTSPPSETETAPSGDDTVPSTDVTVPPDAPTPPATAGSLPSTGADGTVVAGISGLLLVSGAVLLVARRRAARRA
ncbi:DUF5979 domain-containing protein [Ruania alba]|uniref:LPXTG-motif cell wall anchor domain-containing protein n=1 Tax=Ruania alba TaxID=648782 RepID=A0A1H5MEH1_9MICO|nr:DUF5979 domain-containing protein [Ruania alba]SEE87869.1 LPXTG-motif cell wall anchor domain-containing protein [Ruania alba]